VSETERLDQIEHNCLVLASMLGMCAGRTALAQGSSLFVDDMNDAAARLAAHGIPAPFVEAFNGGAKVGMEPDPPDGGSALPSNVVQLFQRRAAA